MFGNPIFSGGTMSGSLIAAGDLNSEKPPPSPRLLAAGLKLSLRTEELTGDRNSPVPLLILAARCWSHPHRSAAPEQRNLLDADETLSTTTRSVNRFLLVEGDLFFSYVLTEVGCFWRGTTLNRRYLC